MAECCKGIINGLRQCVARGNIRDNGLWQCVAKGNIRDNGVVAVCC